MPRKAALADEPDLRPLLRSRDVCQILGIGRRTLDTYIFKGWLPPDRKIGPQGLNAFVQSPAPHPRPRRQSQEDRLQPSEPRHRPANADVRGDALPDHCRG